MTTPTEPSGLLPPRPAGDTSSRPEEPRASWGPSGPYTAPETATPDGLSAREVRVEMTSGRDRVLVIGGALLGALLVVALLVVLFSVRGALPFGHPTAPRPTATPTPVERMLFQEPLTSTTDRNWPNDDQCSQRADGYHVTANVVCLLSRYTPPTNANISVDVKQVSGLPDASYGLAFHRASPGNFYTFEIDGTGRWFCYQAIGNQFKPLAGEKTNPAIHKGLNATNTLMVRISGSHYDFYVNGQPVGSADDSSFTSGQAGLDGNDSIEVVYTNFKVTTTVG